VAIRLLDGERHQVPVEAHAQLVGPEHLGEAEDLQDLAVEDEQHLAARPVIANLIRAHLSPQYVHDFPGVR
jgi:hypothetical protein